MKERNRTASGSERVASYALSLRSVTLTRSLPLAVLLTFCLNVSAQSSWKKQQTGTFAWLHSVFFVDESRGWAVGGKGALLSTTDGGEHWEQRRRPVEDTLHEIAFTDAGTGWIV